MTRKSKPRSGSLAFYPKKRARSEKPFMKSFKREGEKARALNFFGYKAGMTHIIGTDSHEKSPTYGQRVQRPATIIECPPIKIIGLRAYSKTPSGLAVLGEEWVKELPKQVERTLVVKGKKKKKEEKGEKAGEKKEKEEEKKEKSGIDRIEENIGEAKEIRLIGCLQPWLTGIGKKKPEIVEIFLDGVPEKQLEFARNSLGKELLAGDVFNETDFLDVSAVTKGKGFSGVVKRFGVKIHRSKAKKRRVVGSIGPWHPPTVMWTVARAGQLGYQKRTEFNKKLLKIGSDESINPKSGFKHYGIIRNDYLIVEGSVPGPVKRCVALRGGIRPVRTERHKIEGVESIATA